MPNPARPLVRVPSLRTWLWWLALAVVLTLIASLVPRPAYDQTGLANLRYGYPLPFIVQDRSALEVNTYPVFVSWPGAAVHIEVGALLVNVAFFVTACALGRLLLPGVQRPR